MKPTHTRTHTQSRVTLETFLFRRFSAPVPRGSQSGFANMSLVEEFFCFFLCRVFHSSRIVLMAIVPVYLSKPLMFSTAYVIGHVYGISHALLVA